MVWSFLSGSKKNLTITFVSSTTSLQLSGSVPPKIMLQQDFGCLLISKIYSVKDEVRVCMRFKFICI